MDPIAAIGFQRCKLNEIVMDYLVTEGFKDAAEKFSEEADLKMTQVTGSSGEEESSVLMDQRIDVRHAIEEGKILEAVCLINKYYPLLFHEHGDLYFKLQQQHLIELIRKKNDSAAIQFAQEELDFDAEYFDSNAVERTLALLAFDKPETSPYADLLQIAHRQHLASEINNAILKVQMGERDITKPTLMTLIKLCYWSQSQLDKKGLSHKQFDYLSDVN